MHKYYDKERIMGYHFHERSAVNELITQMRMHYLRNKDRANPEAYHAPDALVRRAATERKKYERRIDAGTYSFAKDLSTRLFTPVAQPITILVIEGTFYRLEERGGNMEGIIGADITGKPELYKGPGSSATIDEAVTLHYMGKFLDSHKPELVIQGVRGFDMATSKFFYFNSLELNANFRKKGNTDLVSLLPYVTDIRAPRTAKISKGNGSPDSKITKGYVNGVWVKWPTREDYLKLSPRFSSHRLKRTIAERVAAGLVQDSPIQIRNMVGDWVGHRIKASDRQHADAYLSFFSAVRTPQEEKESGLESGVQQFETSATRFVFLKDHYSNRNTPFNGYNLRVGAGTKGQEQVVRQIQIIDHPNYYGQEINPNDPASHRIQHEKKRDASRADPSKLKFFETYLAVLEKVFGKVKVPVRPL